jgi:hypothetical protein
LHWKEERTTNSTVAAPVFSWCCSKGAVTLPTLGETPLELRKLLSETRQNENGKIVFTERTAHFQPCIRVYNNAFAFTLAAYKVDRNVTNNNIGTYVFRIQGKIHYQIGSLIPADSETPQFAQIYMYDNTYDQVQKRLAIHPELHQDILETITTAMQDRNLYYQICLTLRERLIEDPTTTLKLSIVDVRTQDPRRYNCPTAGDIAAIIVGNDGEEEYNRDIIIQNRHTGIY